MHRHASSITIITIVSTVTSISTSSHRHICSIIFTFAIVAIIRHHHHASRHDQHQCQRCPHPLATVITSCSTSSIAVVIVTTEFLLDTKPLHSISTVVVPPSRHVVGPAHQIVNIQMRIGALPPNPTWLRTRGSEASLLMFSWWFVLFSRTKTARDVSLLAKLALFYLMLVGKGR